ncbi:PspC domain-containing protein [Pleionea mediterranea]|jgi:hypothetical protein|uniref:Uncharacterized protein n=1 Tax=Pleionea mediterranea TaxID=523701 RepID=A0A316G1Z3_9GAMM|nr:PspC domain-containing protein [Pleionea mediterranea]PWK54415.1 hypothetical protein C8D97_101263 [Pleionea mediterranea]
MPSDNNTFFCESTDTEQEQIEEQRYQQLAESGATTTTTTANNSGINENINDHNIQQYRMLYKAIKQTPVPDIPVNFSTNIEQLVNQKECHALLEKWLVRLAIMAMTITFIAVLAPYIILWLSTLSQQTTGVLVLISTIASVMALTDWRAKNNRIKNYQKSHPEQLF